MRYHKIDGIHPYSWRYYYQNTQILIFVVASNAELAMCLLRQNHVSTYMFMGSLLPIFKTLRPGQDGQHFPDDIFQSIFLNENYCILIQISLKHVLKGPIYNNPALVQIMAWRRPGNKPLSEPMMLRLLTHTWISRPKWVNSWHTVHPKNHVNCLHWSILSISFRITSLSLGQSYDWLSDSEATLNNIGE